MHITIFGPQTTGLNARAAARGVFNIPSVATPSYALPGSDNFSTVSNALIQRGALSTTRPRIGNIATGSTVSFFSAADYIGSGEFRIQGPKQSGPRIGTSISGATYALPGHESFQTSSVKLVVLGVLSTIRPVIGNIATGSTAPFFFAADYIGSGEFRIQGPKQSGPRIGTSISGATYALPGHESFQTSSVKLVVLGVLSTIRPRIGNIATGATVTAFTASDGYIPIKKEIVRGAYLRVPYTFKTSLGTFEIIDGDQTISPTSIPSAESFGIPQINQRIYLNSITSNESFGSPTIVQVIQPSSIPSAESFGTPQVNQRIYLNSILSAESFGTPQINQIIYLNSIASAESFGTPTVSHIQTIVPSSISSAENFGTPTIVQVIQPSSISSSESFGAPNVVQVIQPSSISSSESFGSPNVVQVIQPNSISSSESFGTPTIVQVIQPNSIPSSESFGAPNVVQVIQPSSIPSSESFGTPQINQRIYLDTIPSAESFGTPTVVSVSTSSVHSLLISSRIPRKRSSVGAAKLISSSMPSSH